MKIYKTPIEEKQEFIFEGWNFKLFKKNPSNNMYIYTREKDGLLYYEVFKAQKYKNPDGNIIYCYPSTSEFGFGSALCINGAEKDALTKAMFYLNNAFEERFSKKSS